MKKIIRGRPKQPPKEITCFTCDGTKINPDKPEEVCPDCRGTGFLQVNIDVRH